MDQSQSPQPSVPNKSVGPFAIAGIVVLALVAFLLSRGVTLGAEFSLVDGHVEVNAGDRWMEAREGDAVKPGTRIRTGEGKAVIAFDEGSALRLDADTEVEVIAISRDEIRVRDANGRVYSRVNTTSGLTWSVDALDAQVTALGTGFAVFTDPEGKKVSVDVLEHSVKVQVKTQDGSIEKEAPEGTYLAIDFNKPVQDSIAQAQINPKDAQKDPFLSWNLELDKEAASQEAADEPKTEEVETAEESVPAAAEPTAKSVAEAPVKTTAPAPATKTGTPGIKLVGKADAAGIHLSWSMVGAATAPKGFKFLKGQAAHPSYPGDNATFLAPGTTSYDVKLLDGNTWHFRICAWDGGAGCTLYSNDAAVTAQSGSPKEVGAYTYIGTELQLSAMRNTNGISLNWTASSSASFQGYKVVRSDTNPNLFYPQDGYIKFQTDRAGTAFLDTAAVAGRTYYYRICALVGGSVATCGNIAKVD